jgi:hypothetical protein
LKSPVGVTLRLAPAASSALPIESVVTASIVSLFQWASRVYSTPAMVITQIRMVT